MKNSIAGLCIMTGVLLCGAANGDVVLLSEDWNSHSFSTNGWTTEGENWVVREYESGKWAADFWWHPYVYNYEYSLTSKALSGAGYEGVQLDYDLYFVNYDYGSVEQFSVNVYDGSVWEQVALYNNQGGDFDTHESIDISAYAATAGNDLQLKFTAFGQDTYSIEDWFIDNIEVVGTNPVPVPGAAILALLGLLTVNMRRLG